MNTYTHTHAHTCTQQTLQICPDGVIKAANGSLREPSVHNSTDVVVFAPTSVLAAANDYTDVTPGVLGSYLPAANYGFSNSVSGAAWEISAFVMATDAEPKLIIRIAELGGRVRIFSTGVGQPLTQLTGLSPGHNHRRHHHDR